MSRRRAVLLVDIDGIEHSLPGDAFRFFVTESQRWLDRLSESREWVLRQAFVSSASKTNLSPMGRSGIDVVDCPPLTQNQKTGTDIYLAVAALGAAADIGIDEAILVVGRTDIVALLHDLRRRGVTTTVIGNKAVITALGGAADNVVRIDKIDTAEPKAS